MRIAYIATQLENLHIRGGIGGKIAGQMQMWRKQGHEALLFAPSPDEIHAEYTEAFQYGSATNVPVLRSFDRTLSRSRAASRLIEAVRNYQPDLIYLRYGRYIPPLERIFRFALVIIEINTDDINEGRHYGPFLYWSNRFTRSLFLKNAAGLIAVSHEIAELPANKKYGKPIHVISNGIDLEQYGPLPPPKNDTPVITLVAKPNSAWHGVDKLIHLAERCTDLTINIVGYAAEDIRGPIPSNVHPWGFLHREQVKEILGKTDLACGTLALHRKQMQEASPLKVREAAAHGIPLLLGYRDTDLSDLETECLLQIPNVEDNVELYAEQIHSFAYQMRGRRLDRDAVASRIDQRNKEEARLAFFEQIIQNMH